MVQTAPRWRQILRTILSRLAACGKQSIHSFGLQYLAGCHYMAEGNDNRQYQLGNQVSKPKCNWLGSAYFTHGNQPRCSSIDRPEIKLPCSVNQCGSKEDRGRCLARLGPHTAPFRLRERRNTVPPSQLPHPECVPISMPPGIVRRGNRLQ
jgi:hypothetical protein